MWVCSTSWNHSYNNVSQQETPLHPSCPEDHWPSQVPPDHWACYTAVGRRKESVKCLFSHLNASMWVTRIHLGAEIKTQMKKGWNKNKHRYIHNKHKHLHLYKYVCSSTTLENNGVISQWVYIKGYASLGMAKNNSYHDTVAHLCAHVCT